MSIFNAYPASDAEYNGEYFDSQTEAAWAAYLDCFRVEYLHEPETYKLPGGKIYTPDFYLPEMGAYIEVKNGNADNLAAYKMSLLTYTTNRLGFIVSGKPHYATVYSYTPEWTYKPSNWHHPPYDSINLHTPQILDKGISSWLPDWDTETALRKFAIAAGSYANEVYAIGPSEELYLAHRDKKISMREPDNIVDLSDTPMPDGYFHSFARNLY